ncbi:MAG: glycosyltransferase family 4 protein [Phycisphaerales bacterium]|nr:MAG: glycosyltransferase family 4 protein [Phycisphaerales bacterium]
MNSPRIGLVTREWPTSREDSGGIGTYFRNLAVGLSQCGARPVVITGPAAETEPDEPSYPFPVMHLPESTLGLARRLVERLYPETASYQAAAYHTALQRRDALKRYLVPLITQYGIEVLVGPLWGGELADLTKHTGLPVVLRASGLMRYIVRANGDPLDRHGRRLDQLEQRALNSCAALYAPSSVALRELLDCINTPNVPHPVIPSGVDCDLFTPAHTLPAPRCRLLFVGRLEPQKGMTLLTTILPTVLDRSRIADFWFVGRDTPTAPDGGTWQDYLLDACPQRLSRRCRFWGRLPWSGMPEIYRRCAALLVPSTRDRFPNAALEAMACRLPVIASAGAGLAEIIQPGHNGLIIPDRSPGAWAEALCALAATPRQTRQLGHGARSYVEQHLSLTAAAEPVIELCRQAVRRRTTRGVPTDSLEGLPA